MNALSLMSRRTLPTDATRAPLTLRVTGSHLVRRSLRRACFTVRIAALVAVGTPLIVITSAALASNRLTPEIVVGAVDRPKVELSLMDGTQVVGALVAFDGAMWRVLPAPSTVDAAVAPERTIDSTQVAAAVIAPRRDPTLSSGAIPLSLGVLRTPNIQRLPGKLIIESGTPKWDHRWIGACPLDLERVASISFAGDRAIERSPLSDVVTMINGDSLRGFVESIGEDVVLSPIDEVGAEINEPQRAKSDSTATNAQEPREQINVQTSTSGTRKIALDRVASIGFATTPIELSSGIDIWTNDGSIVAAEQLRFDESKGWSFVLADPWLRAVRRTDTSDNASADPLAIVLDRTRFVALSNLPLQTVVAPESAFRHSTRNTVRVSRGDTQLFGCGTVEIIGPAVARFDVPRDEALLGQVTLFTTVSLVRPTPTDARAQIAVRVGTAAPELIELNSQTPLKRVAIKGKIDRASMIEIEVTDGGNGISGDRVLLDRAFLWCDSKRDFRSEKTTTKSP